MLIAVEPVNVSKGCEALLQISCCHMPGQRSITEGHMSTFTVSAAGGGKKCRLILPTSTPLEDLLCNWT